MASHFKPQTGLYLYEAKIFSESLWNHRLWCLTAGCTATWHALGFVPSERENSLIFYLIFFLLFWAFIPLDLQFSQLSFYLCVRLHRKFRQIPQIYVNVGIFSQMKSQISKDACRVLYIDFHQNEIFATPEIFGEFLKTEAAVARVTYCNWKHFRENTSQVKTSKLKVELSKTSPASPDFCQTSPIHKLYRTFQSSKSFTDEKILAILG